VRTKKKGKRAFLLDAREEKRENAGEIHRWSREEGPITSSTKDIPCQSAIGERKGGKNVWCTVLSEMEG